MTISDEVFKTLFRPLIDENEEKDLDDDIYVDQDNEEEDEYYNDEYEDEDEDENEEEYFTVNDDYINTLDTLIEELHDMRRIVYNEIHQYTENQINNIEGHIQYLVRTSALLKVIVEDYTII